LWLLLLLRHVLLLLLRCERLLLLHCVRLLPVGAVGATAAAAREQQTLVAAREIPLLLLRLGSKRLLLHRRVPLLLHLGSKRLLLH
jgi:hypothetical protein